MLGKQNERGQDKAPVGVLESLWDHRISCLGIEMANTGQRRE